MKKFVLILALLFLILSACGDNEAENIEEKDMEIKEEAEAKEKEEAEAKEKEEAEAKEKEEAEAKEKEEAEAKEKEEVEAKEKEEAEAREKEEAEEKERKEEEINNSINDFDNLPQAIKAHLATSIVDERAYADDLTGYTLYYNVDDDKLFVQVHSGVGVGHPVYRVQLDSDSFTPIDGVVNVNAADIEEATVNSSTISKKDLYNHYSENKDVYEAGENNIELADHLTTEDYEWMKDEVQ